VAIVELAGKGWFDSWFGHWTSSETIRAEMEAAGCRLQREYTFLPRQFFLIFTMSQESVDRRANGRAMRSPGNSAGGRPDDESSG
jgi:hypothetical protein